MLDEREDWHLTDLISHELGRGDPFAAAIRATRMPMVITDPRLPDNPIIFANEAFQKLTGYDRAEIVGRSCRFMQGPETDAEAVAAVRRAVANEASVDVDLLNYRKDGSTFWNALYMSPVRGLDGTVQFFFASQLDVTHRIEAQAAIADQKAQIEQLVEARTQQLEAALAVKTTLLEEVDHRVKNNLAMIGALLRLQARSVRDPMFRRTLDAMLERVDALAAVHRRLYQSDDIGKFDVGAFAVELAGDVLGAAGRDDIELVTDVEPARIETAKASAVGLVLNELVTNAVRHGFKGGRAGQLTLRVRNQGAGTEIMLRDDGPGFDVDTIPDGSIGRSLVDRLSRQIGSNTVWNSSARGTEVTLRLPEAN